VKQWLSIVGIGEDGPVGVSDRARGAIAAAEVLVGGERHLALLPADGRPRHTWPRPFDALIGIIGAVRPRRVCVIASGDPFCYGIGNVLARHFPLEEMEVIPAPSAFSLACARLGWNLAEVELLTLHGRALSFLEAHVQPNARLVILSAGGGTPSAVAKLLVERGFSPSEFTVLEHMGGEERTHRANAEMMCGRTFRDLNTIAIRCLPGSNPTALSQVPGLPDDCFDNDGQLTKRAVRAVTVSALAPGPYQLLWDIGAGSGSVAIEWCRAHRSCKAVAVESAPSRAARIETNATRLGTPQVRTVLGEAPAALDGLAAPNAVFVGGSVTRNGLVETCWERLLPGGRMVINVVTVEGEQRIAALWRSLGGELTRIAVSHAGAVGESTLRHGFRPAMPVTQLCVTKPWVSPAFIETSKT